MPSANDPRGEASVIGSSARASAQQAALLARRVASRHEETAARASTNPAARFSTVEIALRNGTVLSHKTDRLYSAEDLPAKFADATGHEKRLAFIPAHIETMQSTAELAPLFNVFAQIHV
ncbi:hypothetical protein PQR75_08065 [Paraburkholderia fungorum]|uniref:hypothetical protein n=1 Tax=Paraburkholderia fungorum TaxID=134537 RepID=UPI0038BC9D78